MLCCFGHLASGHPSCLVWKTILSLEHSPTVDTRGGQKVPPSALAARTWMPILDSAIRPSTKDFSFENEAWFQWDVMLTTKDKVYVDIITAAMALRISEWSNPQILCWACYHRVIKCNSLQTHWELYLAMQEWPQVQRGTERLLNRKLNGNELKQLPPSQSVPSNRHLKSFLVIKWTRLEGNGMEEVVQVQLSLMCLASVGAQRCLLNSAEKWMWR